MRAQHRVAEQQRNRDTEAEHRRDHRLTDTVGHQFRIARAGLRDALERQDHPDDRTDQSQQRTGGNGQAQERLEALELRNFVDDRFVEIRSSAIS